MKTPEAAQANTNKPANVVWGIGVLVAFGLLIAFTARL
jgi:hypothetical protein